jgi:UDP-glucose 4-epimerase
VVQHLAAYAAEGLSHHTRRFNYDTNLGATVNLINAAVAGRARHFVLASSIAVYGTGQLPLREDAVPRPEDPYGIAKYACELDLRAAHEVFGLSFTVFRPHNVYGERQHIGDRYRNVIGIFMNQLMRGEPMTIFGDGTQTRAFSYIGDVAPLIADAIDVPGAYNQTFNVGADESTTVNELAAMVARAMGKEPRINHLEARKEVLHAVADHGRVAEVFGYRATWTLDRGLKQMADWALRVGPREPSRRADVELTRNLPKSWA